MNREDEKIMELLREWDEGLSLDDDSRRALKDRISHGVRDIRIVEDAGSESVPDYCYHIPKSFVWFGAAAAVAAVAACLFLFVSGPGNGGKGGDVLAGRVLSSEELNDLRKVAREVSQVFPEKLRSIVIAKDGGIRVDVGERKGLDADGKLLVRHVVFKRESSSGRWVKVGVFDAIVSTGEPVMFNGVASGYLWTYKVGSGVYEVESDLKLKINGIETRLRVSGGREPGRPASVKTCEIGGVEYRVYQEVAEI